MTGLHVRRNLHSTSSPSSQPINLRLASNARPTLELFIPGQDAVGSPHAVAAVADHNKTYVVLHTLSDTIAEVLQKQGHATRLAFPRSI